MLKIKNEVVDIAKGTVSGCSGNILSAIILTACASITGWIALSRPTALPVKNITDTPSPELSASPTFATLPTLITSTPLLTSTPANIAATVPTAASRTIRIAQSKLSPSTFLYGNITLMLDAITIDSGKIAIRWLVENNDASRTTRLSCKSTSIADDSGNAYEMSFGSTSVPPGSRVNVDCFTTAPLSLNAKKLIIATSITPFDSSFQIPIP